MALFTATEYNDIAYILKSQKSRMVTVAESSISLRVTWSYWKISIQKFAFNLTSKLASGIALKNKIPTSSPFSS